MNSYHLFVHNLYQVLYTAAINPRINQEGYISNREVFDRLSNVHCATPVGQVSFDKNRINSLARTIFVQQQDLTSTPDILDPSAQKTVYLHVYILCLYVYMYTACLHVYMLLHY
jgi:hypothetical protein